MCELNYPTFRCSFSWKYVQEICKRISRVVNRCESFYLRFFFQRSTDIYRQWGHHWISGIVDWWRLQYQYWWFCVQEIDILQNEYPLKTLLSSKFSFSFDFFRLIIGSDMLFKSFYFWEDSQMPNYLLIYINPLPHPPNNSKEKSLSLLYTDGIKFFLIMIVIFELRTDEKYRRQWQKARSTKLPDEKSPILFSVQHSYVCAAELFEVREDVLHSFVFCWEENVLSHHPVL
jgi:hypothetical protein